MGKALYRKHRPKKLSEVVGQEHITQTLSNALASGQVGHAYLLTGPRGTGKTSIARILAHEVNGLPYEDDATHLDIIEIDAASNRRIDEIRELRDRIHIAPTSAKYKVYIIDEVHMLTREAFNALLKTLEEPPEHAIFILATTEAHKLPDTIVSRTQRFSLRPVALDGVVKHLEQIAIQEGITISPEAMGLVAEHGQGSFRDSIGLLDQIKDVSKEAISIEHVESALGRAPQALVAELAEALDQGQLDRIASLVTIIRERAVQPAELATQLAELLRTRLVTDPASFSGEQLAVLGKLVRVPSAHNPQLALELTLFEPHLASAPAPATSTQQKAATANPVPRENPQPVAKKPSPQPASKPAATIADEAQAPKESDEPDEPTEDTPAPSMSEVDLSSATDAPTPGDWQDILTKLKGHHNTLYGIVRMATPEMQPGTISLVFGFPFHQKRVSDARYTKILSDTAQSVLGYPVTIKTSLEKKSKSAKPEPEEPAPTDLGKITEVFGDDISVDQA